MARRLVLFSDGTANTVGKHDSNVLRLCKMLDYSAGANQVAIYDPGVGTMTSVEELRRRLPTCVNVIEDEATRPELLRWLELPFGLGAGAGTQRNIRRLYRALVQFYEPGDEVLLFGFSRGAFTVRALAGIIYRCGLPRIEHVTRVQLAIELCQQHFEACESAKELAQLKQAADRFRRDYSHVCDIRFLGVWDTVKSVGYMFPRNLPHTRHNPIIQTVRHALALSERRSFFATTTWGGLDGDTRPAVYVPAHLPGEQRPIAWQDVEEVWFPGDHSDVGGSHESTTLANVPLHWMVNEAHAAGLRVDSAEYERIVPDLERLSHKDVHDSMSACWKICDYMPRRDIDNEPPPPRLSPLWPRPLGPRQIAATARRTVVKVHRSAIACYPASAAPWSGANVRFVDTTERVPRHPQ